MLGLRVARELPLPWLDLRGQLGLPGLLDLRALLQLLRDLPGLLGLPGPPERLRLLPGLQDQLDPRALQVLRQLLLVLLGQRVLPDRPDGLVQLGIQAIRVQPAQPV